MSRPASSRPRLALNAYALAALLSLAACGGGSVDGSVTLGTPVEPVPPAPFTLSLSADKALVLQGTSASVTVNLVRQAGFDGEVQVSLAGLPAGVTAGSATIAAGATSATLTLQAAAGAPHSLPTDVRVTGIAGARSASQGLMLTVRGPAGSVDTSFAAGGRALTAVGAGEDYANVAAVQADGRLIVAGSSAAGSGTQISIVRYGRDGTLDTSFGNAGRVMPAMGAQGNDQALAIALQPDGKILVAGRSDGDFVLLRLNADGSADTGFGSAGRVRIDFAGGTDVARALLVMPDGKIVIGGEASAAGSTTGIDFALARCNPDGSLDAGFGIAGKLTTAMKTGSGTDAVHALALQTVGGAPRILAVGGEGDFMAARYTDSGALDAGFGSGGRIVGLFNANIGSANAVALMPDGRAVLAGHIGHQTALVRLNLDGSLDASFGAGGRLAQVSATLSWNEATAVVRQADGKLVVGGWMYTGNSSSGDFAVMRLLDSGVPDAGFGAQGLVIAPMAAGTLNDQAHALVLQPDERLPAVRAIQAGEANGANHDFVVTRFWL